MKKFLEVVSVVFAFLLMCGIAFYGNQPSKEKVYMSTSWMTGYAEVESLTKDSDLIGLIRVKGLEESIDGRIPASVFRVKVLDEILGCQKGDEILVYMTGGEKDGQIFEIDSDPLMEKGQEFLIFASHNQDGTYTVLGGPQGRMLYENGGLSSLQNTSLPHTRASQEESTSGSEEVEGINFKNEPLDDVKAQINNALQ